MNIYPNPSRDEIFTIGPTQGKTVMSVVDLQGRVIDNFTITTANALTFQLTVLPGWFIF